MEQSISVRRSKTESIVDGQIRAVVEQEVIQHFTRSHQPLSSTKKNCTAIFSSLHFLMFSWVVIPCDEAFQASFVCQEKTHPHYNPSAWSLNAVNTTCDKGWVLLEGTRKCILLLEPSKDISFSEAHRKCMDENSSIISIDSIYERQLSKRKTFLLSLMNKIAYWNFDEERSGNIKKLNKIYNILFGLLLEKDNPENKLATLLSLVMTDERQTRSPLDHIKLFAKLNDHHCGLIEYIEEMKALFCEQYPSNQYLNSWHAKYRSCSHKISVDVLICEKQSKQYVSAPQCAEGFFRCGDNTCVLLIYKCDDVNDCFDESDENNCTFTLDRTHSIGNETIYIPCELNNNCSMEGSHTLLTIQQLCDGIYPDIIFIDEKRSCQFHKINKIDLTAMVSKLSLHFHVNSQYNLQNAQARSLINLLGEEIGYNKKEVLFNMLNTSIAAAHIMYLPRKVSCAYHGGGNVVMGERCKISIHSIPCNYGFTKQICEDVLCPGMFKCNEYYCIRMSAVCDGQQDCLHGDDEDYCKSLFCPGFLKCRGEMRCVGQEEMCDGHPDCKQSFDDELICDSCPDNCECQGYMMLCTSDTLISGILYRKGLIITKKISTFHISPFYMKYILYLSVSSRTLKRIIFKPKIIVDGGHLLFANFSINDLTSLGFIANNFFVNMLILDVSKNSIMYVNMARDQLAHLLVIYLTGNPITSINFDDTFHQLRSIYMSEIQHYSFMTIIIPINCQLIVSDSDLCCISPSLSINCKSTNTQKICFGLFTNISVKCTVYILNIICIFLISCVIYKTCRKLYVSNGKKYYNVVKCNHIISDLFSNLYFSFLIGADIFNVNAILWRTESICVFLRTTISITLQSSIIFKTIVIIIISLKIRYPFRHQLRYMKSIPLAAGAIWFLLFSYNIVDLVHAFSRRGGPYLDSICSCFDCHKDPNLVHLFVRLFDVCCIAVVGVTGIATYHKLNTEDECNIMSTKTISSQTVTFKIIRSFLFEAIFRVCLCLLYTYRPTYVNATISQSCLAIVLYLVPVNLIVTAVFNLLDVL